MTDPIDGIRSKAQTAIRQIETKYAKEHKVSKEDLAEFHETIKNTLKNIESARGLKKGTITEHFKKGDISQVLKAVKNILQNTDDLAIVGAFQTLLHKLHATDHTNLPHDEGYKVKKVDEKQGLDKGR